MNNRRRKQLTLIASSLDAELAILREVLEAEQEAFDNMPDGIRDGTRGETAQQIIDNLETAADDLENLMATLGDIEN
jgi:flagellin-like hook-associated protein FlgL